MEVLAERGPDGTTIGAIAKRAHVAPGTFYNHYPTLADLVSTVAEELATGVEIGRDLLAEVEHDPAARVLIGTRQLLELTVDDPVSARAFVALLATIPELRTRVRSIVRGAIVDGVNANRFAEIDPEVTADALLGAVVQWMRTRLAGDSSSEQQPDQLRLALHIVGVPADEIAPLIDGLPAPPA
jgi:AcrR family transcriptional regulator